MSENLKRLIAQGQDVIKLFKTVYCASVLFLFTTSISCHFFAAQNTTAQPTPTTQAALESNYDEEFETLCFELFTRDFGYTLLGIKPISTDELPRKYCDKLGERCFAKLKETFDKSPNFVLKIIQDGPFYSVELINRGSLRALVKRNSFVRSFVREIFCNEQNFYSKIENPSRSIHRILKVNERVIGHCLGYDETNVKYYLRRIDLGIYLQKYPLVRFHPLPGGKYSDCPNIFTDLTLRYKRLTPSNGFDSLEAEWQWIKRVEWDIVEESKPVPPYFVYLPIYVCRHGGGSEAAREKFTMASHKIAELFCNKRPSEVVAGFASRSYDV